jgi:N-acyl homoserine lactone hydrolase
MLRLHVFNTGWVSMQEGQLYLGGGSALRTLPILSFVIEHPRGLLVFDTGLNAAFAAHPSSYVGPFGNQWLPFRSAPGMNLAAQMRAHGLPPEDVTHVVLSHLHYDHSGDLRAFPESRLVVTRQEWRAAQALFKRSRGYLGKDYAGLAFTLLDFPPDDGEASNPTLEGEYGLDMLDDGSLILVPTFGHTHGHQSLLVFLRDGVVLLAGDAVYVHEGYTMPAAQPHADAPESAWRSTIALRILAKEDPQAIIVPTHDDRTLQDLDRPDIVLVPQERFTAGPTPG